MSPLLFAIFLNDFENFVGNYYDGLKYLSEEIRARLSDDDVDVYLRLFTLLYADDTVVLAESDTELQNALNAVHDYCQTWYITINITKTKVVIFSKGKIRKFPIFKFGNDSVEVTSDYVYLGTTFNYNNKFNKARTKQINQARRAMIILLTKSRKLKLPVDIQLELFDQLVLPILLYGCEIWGYENISHIEVFYRKFCKQLLRLNSSTSNCMIYGELGKYPMMKTVECRMLNFWCRIINSKDYKLSKIMYRLLKNMYDNNLYKSPWLTKIYDALDKCGLVNLAHESFIKNVHQFKHIVNRKLTESYVNQWRASLLENSQCTTYQSIKAGFGFENYLGLLNDCDRISLCKFRCGNHRLPIVTGRYQKVSREERLCTLCDSQSVGDEYHYLFQCPSAQAERSNCIVVYSQSGGTPDEQIQELFNVTDTFKLHNLAVFCRHIMNKF